MAVYSCMQNKGKQNMTILKSKLMEALIIILFGLIVLIIIAHFFPVELSLIIEFLKAISCFVK